MTPNKTGRAVFYTRDSGGKHETTPGQYVSWAISKTAELGLVFRGRPEQIDEMIRSRQSHSGDLFLDYEVQGHLFSRPGLDGLLNEVKADKSITHVLIPKRDRFARPEVVTDALALEDQFLRNGVSLVFMDRIVLAPRRGQRRNIADSILAVIDYEHAGKQRRDLAKKMIYAQLALAKAGYSTGGPGTLRFSAVARQYYGNPRSGVARRRTCADGRPSCDLAARPGRRNFADPPHPGHAEIHAGDASRGSLDPRRDSFARC